MLKLWVRNTLLFFVVIAISTFAGWCAYTVTRNNQEDYAAQVSAAGARQSDEKMEPQAEGASAAFECYTVRLEGEKFVFIGHFFDVFPCGWLTWIHSDSSLRS